MIMSMLVNAAIASGKLAVDEDAKNVRLVSKVFGVTTVFAKVSKEAIYQMSRTPDMPETLEQAVAAVSESQEKVLADEPVPLPVSRPARQRPALSVVQGGRA